MFTDANGHVHTRRCWERAEGVLMDELVTHDLDSDIDYIGNEDGTKVIDYTIPSWDTTQQIIVSLWLSDGTVFCDCD